MRQFILLTLLTALSCGSAVSQLTLKKLTRAELPRDCEFQGEYLDSYTWKDSLGLNYLVRSQEYATTKSPNGETLNSGYVYIYHYYLRKTGDYFLRLGVIDFEKNCRHNMNVAHIENAVSLTDIDKDGYGEVTTMYIIDCQRREGSMVMKLMFMEDGRKFALRGISKKGESGGDYEPTEDFYRYPEFLKFCEKFWHDHARLH
ncbi:MAG: M949_RS01915 family surface polysaccharide biosynthesis protein [Flavobacteriales bacterium]